MSSPLRPDIGQEAYYQGTPVGIVVYSDGECVGIKSYPAGPRATNWYTAQEMRAGALDKYHFEDVVRP